MSGDIVDYRPSMPGREMIARAVTPALAGKRILDAYRGAGWNWAIPRGNLHRRKPEIPLTPRSLADARRAYAALPPYHQIGEVRGAIVGAMEVVIEPEVATAMIGYIPGALGKRAADIDLDDCTDALMGVCCPDDSDPLSDDCNGYHERPQVSPLSLACAIRLLLTEAKFLPTPAELADCHDRAIGMLRERIDALDEAWETKFSAWPVLLHFDQERSDVQDHLARLGPHVTADIQARRKKIIARDGWPIEETDDDNNANDEVPL